MANTIECKCGCGQKTKDKDKYARTVEFINGHNGRKYKDPMQHKREWNHRNKKSRYINKIKRGHQLKKRIIILLGGKCVECGVKYNGKNACIFQVHHLKPNEKIIVINIRTLTNYGWAKIMKEIKGCQLLCANCHFVKHNKEY